MFEIKKRDEHWNVMGACAELMIARVCAVTDERAMEVWRVRACISVSVILMLLQAQQWVRKASRSADRVSSFQYYSYSDHRHHRHRPPVIQTFRLLAQAVKLQHVNQKLYR